MCETLPLLGKVGLAGVLETNFLHISEAQILVLYINFHSPAKAFFLFFVLQCGKLKLKNTVEPR